MDLHLNKNFRLKYYKNILNFIEKEYAKKIEKSIYKFSKKYAIDNNMPFLLESIYESKYNDIISLFNKKKELLKKVIYNKTIKASKIAFLKPEELLPDVFENYLNKKKKFEPEGSKLYKCSKCKKNNCLIDTKQTRPADEPPSIIIKCLECGNMEKFDE